MAASALLTNLASQLRLITPAVPDALEAVAAQLSHQAQQLVDVHSKLGIQTRQLEVMQEHVDTLSRTLLATEQRNTGAAAAVASSGLLLHHHAAAQQRQQPEPQQQQQQQQQQQLHGSLMANSLDHRMLNVVGSSLAGTSVVCQGFLCVSTVHDTTHANGSVGVIDVVGSKRAARTSTNGSVGRTCWAILTTQSLSVRNDSQQQQQQQQQQQAEVLVSAGDWVCAEIQSGGGHAAAAAAAVYGSTAGTIDSLW